MANLATYTQRTIPRLSDAYYLVRELNGVAIDHWDEAKGIFGLLAGTPPQGRLTTEAGVSVSTADRTAQSILYYTSHNGGRCIWLYDGTKWKMHYFSEFALQLSDLIEGELREVSVFALTVVPSQTDTTLNEITFGAPTGWATGSQITVDIGGGGLNAFQFYYWRAIDTLTGTLHPTCAHAIAGTNTVDLTDPITQEVTGISLELSAAWTNSTTRAISLTAQDNVIVMGGAPTRLVVGLIRATGGNTTEDSAGGVTNAVGGKRFVWNRYNQEDRHLLLIGEGGWGAFGWRQLGGVAGNKVEYICGHPGARLAARWSATVDFTVSNGGSANLGIGVDSTSTPSGSRPGINRGGTIQTDQVEWTAAFDGQMALGYHYLAPLERAENGPGGSGATLSVYSENNEGQSGFAAWIRG